MNHSNWDTQNDEIELLKNILFDQLEVKEEVPLFTFDVTINCDEVPDPKLNLVLSFTLPEQYPDCEPKVEINDKSLYLATTKLKLLSEKIKTYCSENLSMPMIYQVYEISKEFVNEQELEISKENTQRELREEEEMRKYQIKLEMQNKKEELIETRTFTKVTKENFEEWFKKFYAKNNKVCKKKLEQEQRQTGREYFMNIKNLKGEDYDENDIKKEDDTEVESGNEGNAMFFDAEAFEENIDDIDFDKIDVDDI
jgi:hypothetical protein